MCIRDSSSANSEALAEEWTRHGLVQHMDVVLGQDAGTKEAVSYTHLRDAVFLGEHMRKYHRTVTGSTSASSAKPRARSGCT